MNPIHEARKEALRPSPLPAPKPLARTPPAPAKPEPESHDKNRDLTLCLMQSAIHIAGLKGWAFSVAEK